MSDAFSPLSGDATQSVACAAGALVLSVARGRGPQLRAGATLARGDILLFLHADTRFPAGGLAAILNCLEEDPAALAGC